MRKCIPLIAPTLVLVTLLSGCGTKGPLTLTSKPTKPVATQAAEPVANPNTVTGKN